MTAPASGSAGLRSELIEAAAWLLRADAQARIAGPNTYVRVKDPAFLAHLLTHAATVVDTITAERDRLRAALNEAEACLSIVEPRTDRAEYLRTLDVVRAALPPHTDPREDAGDAAP